MMIEGNLNISDNEYITLHIYEANSEEDDSMDDGRVEFTVQFDGESAQLIQKTKSTNLEIKDKQAGDVNSESAETSNTIMNNF